MMAVLASGCVPPSSSGDPAGSVDPTVAPAAAALLVTLPVEAGGLLFDETLVVDDGFHSPSPVDDVLIALAKHRSDALLVSRSAGGVTIGAVSVRGVSGYELLNAFASSWKAESVIRRSPRQVGGGIGVSLIEASGAQTVAYIWEDYVYLISTPSRDPQLVEAILSAMPSGPVAAPTQVPAANLLLTRLPTEAAGLRFGEYQIVDDSINVGLPVDDVLRELDKSRSDAVAVYRWTADVTIGATTVEGISGDTLLQAFVEAWDAPAVVSRTPRVFSNHASAWVLKERSGQVTVFYSIGKVVYMVSSRDNGLLEAVLATMPRA